MEVFSAFAILCVQLLLCLSLSSLQLLYSCCCSLTIKLSPFSESWGANSSLGSFLHRDHADLGPFKVEIKRGCVISTQTLRHDKFDSAQ